MTADVGRVAAGILAVAGLLAAAPMLAKSRLAAAGKLTEPSIVERPEARLILGIPNALFGLAYYALVVAASVIGTHALIAAAAAASVPALATTLVLAVALLRRHLACPRCWTAHAVNALLCPLLVMTAR